MHQINKINSKSWRLGSILWLMAIMATATPSEKPLMENGGVGVTEQAAATVDENTPTVNEAEEQISTPVVETANIPSQVVEPTPTAEEVSFLRANLAKVKAERDAAINHLEGIRADVNTIRQDQAVSQARASSLDIDLRAVLDRITILEKNSWEQTKRNLAEIANLELKLRDAMDAARYCGENLVNSENRGRTATTQIARLHQESENLTRNLAASKDQLTEKIATLAATNNQLAQREETLGKVSAQLQEREATLAVIQNQLTEREETLTKFQLQIQENETILTATTEQLTQREAMLTTTNEQLQAQAAILASTQKQLVEREETLTKFQGQLQEKEMTLTEIKEQLTQREATLATIGEQLKERSTTLATLQDQFVEQEALTKALHINLASVAQERNDARNRVTTLESENIGLRGDLDNVNQNLTALNTKYTDLNERHEQLIVTFAPVDGGTLDAKTARALATEAYRNYRTIWMKHLRYPRDSALIAQARQARNDLFIAQYQVMRVNGGSELYIVRPNDSLSILARLVFDDGSRGVDLREANSHLLKNNDPLLVGTPLVVP